MPTIKGKTSSRKEKAMETFAWQLKAHKLPDLDKEIRFHPKRKWRIDYGYPELKIGVEYEGGIYGIGKACPVCRQRKQGGHTRGKHFESDSEKYAEANLLGWIIIRTADNMIQSGLTIDLLKRAYDIRKGERCS